MRIGTVILPGTSMLTENDIDTRLSQSRSDCIIVDSQLAEKVERIAHKHKKTLKHKIFVGTTDLFEGKTFGPSFKLGSQIKGEFHQN